MVVYRYTLRKFLRTPSTWVLLVIGILTMFFLGGFLTFWLLGQHWDLKNSDEIKSIAMKTAFIIDYSSPGTTICLLIAVFAGFKGAQVFRDEIEDGSFLIVLSKPLSRKRILIQKWLAFMTIFIIFVISLCLFHALGALAAQKGSYVTGYLWQAIPIETGISMIFMLIFSSIALIISTFLSSKGVIGVVFVLGMSIVFTQFISQFTYKPSFSAVGISRNAPESLRPGSTKNFLYMRNKAITNQDIEKANFKAMLFNENNLYINNPDALNTYNHIWPFDLSYHINLMDSLVVKSVISQDDRAYKNFSGQVADGLVQKQVADGWQNPSTLNLNYFMGGSDYTIMEILMNTFSAQENNQDIANLWTVFSSAITTTNNWINSSLNSYKPTQNSGYSYAIDITSGGTNNSDAPFNNYNNNIREIWTKLLRGHDNSDKGLEGMFKNFGDNRFIANEGSRDKVDNNIFSLIMGYFQTQTIVDSINSLIAKTTTAIGTGAVDEPLDINCYQYMKNGYQALSEVAHTLGKSQPVYSHDQSKIDWNSLKNKIVKVKYVDFGNAYSIMAVYLSIAIVLLPTAYLIIRRQDFN